MSGHPKDCDGCRRILVREHEDSQFSVVALVDFHNYNAFQVNGSSQGSRDKTSTMNDSNTSALDDGWKDGDFSEPASFEVDLDDPWGPTRLAEDISELNGNEGGKSQLPDQFASEQASLAGDSKNEEASAFVSTLVNPETTELADLLKEDGWPSGDEWFGLIETDDVIGEDDYDEPEASAEFDGDRREDLFEGIDLTSDLSRSIRIDGFISGIREATTEERRQIAELLRDISTRRLQSWLPWFRNQLWTGETLLLFLEFRLTHWEANYEWWDCVFWHRGLRCWWTQPNSSALSLDETYELVQLRLTLSPDRVIDPKWLTDWNDFMPWRFGVQSFANFAVLRAQLKEDIDWRGMLSENPLDLDGVEPDERRLAIDLPMANDKEYWLAHQDWHDPADWHDNLGWVVSRLDIMKYT